MHDYRLWFGLLAVVIPYSFICQRIKQKWQLKVKALAWSMEILPQQDGYQYVLRIPFFERLKK